MPKTQGTLRLAAVVFTDIVGYSAVVHRDPALGARLLDRQRRVVRACIPRFGGREIETAGDSFLLEFGSALAALQCVAEIQRALHEANRGAAEGERVQLRASVHLGDVEHRGREIFGDGVNVSARILPFSPEGGVAMSDVANRQVQSRLNAKPASIGVHALKNIAQGVEIFTLDPSALAALQTTSIPLVDAPHRRPAWLWLALAGGVLALVAAMTLTWLGRMRGGTAGDAEKSIAVLPFANLSAEPDSQYFTDGLHDSVITHIAGVRDLRVISRTSVMRYRDGTRNLREIAEDLGVAHIVEGSVQRAGQRLRVNAQLIRAADDSHVWATDYDRDISDLFAVQAELAEQIAHAVDARLRPEEKARIERVPTSSPAAYELFLRAAAVGRQSTRKAADLREAIAALDQALALDPQFAGGHALLSILHDTLFWAGHDRTDARVALARAAADTALRLDPNLADAHLARGINRYHGSRDYAGAIEAFERARQLAPNDGEVRAWLAYVYRRQNRWDDALENLAAAASLDPRNENVLWEYAQTLAGLRRFAEADRAYARLETFATDSEAIQRTRAWLQVDWHGRVEAVEPFLTRLPVSPDPGCQAAGARWQIHVWRRRFDEAAAAMLACPDREVNFEDSGSVPKEFLVAEAYTIGGAPARAAPYYRRVRPQLEAARGDAPLRFIPRLSLAATLAGLGERAAAKTELQQVLAGIPPEQDSINAAFALSLAAELYVRLGEVDLALAALERSLQMPYGTSAWSVHLNPQYDSVRDHPRFQALVAGRLTE